MVRQTSQPKSAPALDRDGRAGYTMNRGVAGSRLTQAICYVVTVGVQPGGYFFFMIWITRLIIERITNEYSKRISKVTIQSPPSFGEGRGQRSDAPANGGPTASTGNICHSLPMDRIAWFDGLRNQKGPVAELKNSAAGPLPL